MYTMITYYAYAYPLLKLILMIYYIDYSALK